MKRFVTNKSYAPTHILRIAIVVLLSFGGIGIVGGTFLLRQSMSNANEIKKITDTSRYQEIRHQLWSKKEQIKHFPHQIPKDVKGTRLVYSQGFLEGGTFFQLRVKQPPKEIQKLLSDYRKIAKHKYMGGDTNDHANQPNGVPTTFFYTSDSGEESFPASYEILVLDAQDRGSPGFKWNHGNSYGVAINSSISEIVYWAEEW
jgi:hypothetical protein